MTLSFRELSQHRLKHGLFARWAESLILKRPGCKPVRVQGIVHDMRTAWVEMDGVRYHQEVMTVEFTLDQMPRAPDEDTALRRASDPPTRWFSFAGPGEGESADTLILEWAREIPDLAGGQRVQ